MDIHEIVTEAAYAGDTSALNLIARRFRAEVDDVVQGQALLLRAAEELEDALDALTMAIVARGEGSEALDQEARQKAKDARTHLQIIGRERVAQGLDIAIFRALSS